MVGGEHKSKTKLVDLENYFMEKKKKTTSKSFMLLIGISKDDKNGILYIHLIQHNIL